MPFFKITANTAERMFKSLRRVPEAALNFPSKLFKIAVIL